MDSVKVEYFSAPWCGPCRSIKPVIDSLIADGWNIEKIDTDADRARAQAASIRAVPTFIIYKDGIQVQRFSGARSDIPQILKQIAQ